MPGAAIRVDIVRAADPAWEDWLERVPRDIFHTAGYHAYSEASGEGEANLLVVGDSDRGLAWPYLLRPITGATGRSGQPLTDITSVYGYPGPLAWGCRPGDAFVADAWREIQEAWRAQGAITAFTRFHPLLGNASIASGLRAAQADGPPARNPIVAGGQTVSIDLSLGYDGVRALYGRDLRREIDASRRAGLVTVADVEWSELGTFARLYNQTMTRLHASDYYLFKESDFLRLREALGGRLHLLLTRINGDVAAAGLFTDWYGLAEWYLVGTDSTYACALAVEGARRFRGRVGDRAWRDSPPPGWWPRRQSRQPAVVQGPILPSPPHIPHGSLDPRRRRCCRPRGGAPDRAGAWPDPRYGLLSRVPGARHLGRRGGADRSIRWVASSGRKAFPARPPKTRHRSGSSGSRRTMRPSWPTSSRTSTERISSRIR